ncbi:MAG: MFS transporter [Pseudomonadota bacterium]
MQRDPAILLLAIGQTLAWASIYYVFPALLLRWEQELGWSKTELTAAITLAILVSALASPLMGRLIDRGLGAPMMGGCTVLGGIGLLLLSGVTEKWQFYAIWFVMGLAMSGCLYEPCFALITRARQARAKQGIILITLAAGFASTICYPVVFSLSETFGWRLGVAAIAFVVMFVVAPVQWLGVRKLQSDASESDAKTVAVPHSRAFLSKPKFWLLAFGFACLAAAHGAVLHHLLPLMDERGLSPEVAVLTASFIGPMQVAGRLAMMATENYISNHGVARTAFAMMGLSMLMLLGSGVSLAFLLAFVVLFGSAWGTVNILRPLLAREILGEQNFGAKSGALAVPYLVGSASAPYFGALIWSVGGYDLMIWVLLGFAVLGLSLYSYAYALSKT